MSGVFCSSCGKENSSDAYYCEFCGANLAGNTQTVNNNFSSGGANTNINSGAFYQDTKNQNVSYGSGQSFNPNVSRDPNFNKNPMQYFAVSWLKRRNRALEIYL